MSRLPLRAAAWLTVVAAFATAFLGGPDRSLPPIVFVARQPLASGEVPGLGPGGRTAAAGGHLMLRSARGEVSDLLPAGRFFDVADPSVSYDGRTIAFSGLVHPDSAWRIWRVSASGDSLRPLTRSDREVPLDSLYGDEGRRFERYDDFDPCWMPDGTVAFASTRFPIEAEQGDVLTSNLWLTRPDGSDQLRITSERNGAEEPSIDPTRGRIVFARWFFSRFRPSLVDTSHVTTDPALAMPMDSVNLWHAVSTEHDGDFMRLQGGDGRHRDGQMAYQPVVRGDTTLIGVRPQHSALLPDAGRLGLQAFPHGMAAARPLAGLGSDLGWSACAPAVLPDGRLLFSLAGHAGEPFELWVMDARDVTRGNRRRARRLLARAGEHLLDAAVLAARPQPPPPMFPGFNPFRADDRPRMTLEQIVADERDVRFDCLNVFANGPVNHPTPDAVKIQRGLRIRFFSVVPRPGRPGADSLVLVDDKPVHPQGGVFVDAAPADQPMFEQLIDAQGRVVRSAGGPAHVPGFNFARPGAGTKCVGCHTGHSTLFVQPTRGEGEYTNVSTSATATASGSWPGTRGPAAAIDRRTQGDPAQVAWIADSQDAPWLRLSWNLAIEARSVVVYPLSSLLTSTATGTVRRAELVLLDGGREVRRLTLDHKWRSEGTRVAFPLTRMDALELRLVSAEGRYLRRPAAGVAEIETIARLAWEQ